VAVGAAAVSGLACLVAVALLTRGGAWGLPSAANAPVDLAVGLAYSLMGALVVVHGRGSRTVGRLMLGAGTAAASAALAGAVALTADDVTWAARAAAQLSSALWVPGFLPLITLLPLGYPDGLLAGRVWRALRAVSVVGIALFTVGVAVYPEPVAGQVRLDKLVVSGAVAQVLVPIAVPLLVAGLFGGLAALVVRLRRSSGLARRQIVVLLAAAALLALDVALQGVLPAPANVLSQAVAVALVPVAIGVAVTRHRLYDLDLAVCRTLAGASLAVCLAGVYLTAFGVLRAAVSDRTAVASGVAAALTGLLVLPLGTRLARGVDRLFYGDRADRYLVLSAFSATLRERLDVSEVPQAVCDAIVASLRLGSAELVLDSGRRVAAGTADGPAARVPLRHRGSELGSLTVTPRPGERVLDERDVELVAALADSAAPAIAALQLSDSLQQAREHLVAAREEERRRVRRDLHDGVGAALAGVRLQLDSARDLVEYPLGGKLLDAAADGLAEAVRDLRSVTDDLRPPALDDLGLAASLQALAARLRTPALDVEVDIAALPSLPAAVDVACYRIAAEAMANAARHAAARRVVVRVRVEGGELLLSVRDDGRGLPDRPRGRGLGLTSMRQRTEEIGGRFELVAAAPGTAVSAALPLGAA
jgi:two-component system NarL family sensor kinase